MADRGILFSAPMVSAIIAGRKTQTRRLIEPTKKDLGPGQLLIFEGPRFGGTAYRFIQPFAPGDRLYVREGYYQRGNWQPVVGSRTKGGRQKWAFVPADDVIVFEAPAEFRKGRHNADPKTIAWHQRLGRFMPRKYSRLTLDVTDVRVERLQSCSEADAIAEGVRRIWPADIDTGGPNYFTVDVENWSINAPTAAETYKLLWDWLHTADGQTWADNPWVVAVTFDAAQRNIDAEAA